MDCPFSSPAFVPASTLFPRRSANSTALAKCPSRLNRAQRRAQFPSSRPLRVRMAAGSGASDGDEAPGGRLISTALEVSYRTVWINLLTSGVGDAYEESIQQFCVACIAARKVGYTVTALKFELAANELTTDDPEQQKALLNDREKEMRLIWVSLVFLVLRRYGFSAGNTPMDDDILAHFKSTDEKLARGLEAIVESVGDAADRGFTLKTFKMERAMQRAPDEEAPSPSTASIESQWGRIIFSTIALLPESLKEKKKKQ